MTTLLGPYSLSETNEAPFDVEWDQTQQPPIGVELQNISGLLLMVKVGGSQYWLTPWTARYFEVAQNSVKLTVEPLGDLSPTEADPLRLLATVFEVNDTPPDEMQRSLASLALVAGISGEVTLASGAVVNLANGAQVGIQGTPSVAVSNALTVGIANGSTVGINGTPNVNASGTVGIQNAGVQLGTTNVVGLIEQGGMTINLAAGASNYYYLTTGIAGTAVVDKLLIMLTDPSGVLQNLQVTEVDFYSSDKSGNLSFLGGASTEKYVPSSPINPASYDQYAHYVSNYLIELPSPAWAGNEIVVVFKNNGSVAINENVTITIYGHLSTMDISSIQNIVGTFVKSPSAINTPTVNNTTFVGTSGTVTFSTGTGTGIGSLAILVLLIEVSPGSGPYSPNLALPSGWSWAQTSVSAPGGSYPFVEFVAWGILNQSTISGFNVSLKDGSGVAFNGTYYYLTMLIGSGGNLAFSNQNLTGIVSSPITWSSTGVSNSNLVLPSSSPGLMIGTWGYGSAPSSFSLGKGYGGNPGLWIVSNMTGAFGVQTSSNPDSGTYAFNGETGIIIPQ